MPLACAVYKVTKIGKYGLLRLDESLTKEPGVRIANLVLLNRIKNTEAENYDFDDKKGKCLQSSKGVATLFIIGPNRTIIAHRSRRCLLTGIGLHRLATWTQLAWRQVGRFDSKPRRVQGRELI
jgi:hypothetical protein